MPGISNDDKLARFKSEVLETAAAEAGAITEKVGEKRERLLSEGRRAIDSELAEWLDGELKALHRKNARAYAIQSTELREKQLLDREAVIDGITEKARQKLLEYAAGEEYGKRLAEICVSVASLRDESFTVYLSPSDAAKYKLQILRALEDFQERRAAAVGYTEHVAPVYTVVTDKDIRIGGVKFLSAQGGVFINETLDEYLRMGRDGLAETVEDSVRDE